MKRRRFKFVSTVLFTAVLALASTLAYAQGAAMSTTLSGSVVDVSGGVVPGADILAKHNQTASEYRAVSDSTGHFTITAIAPGPYTVTVTLSGFKTVVLPDVTVMPGTPATIKPVTLDVGRLEETVTVTGATEIVQTQTSAVTTTLTTRQISQTPLPTRNTLDFVASLPGVNTTNTLRNSTVMGLPGSALNITIDGLNTMDQALKSTAGSSFFSMINPRLDAVEEVSVSTANPGAESSGQGSVQIRFQTRSGTNKFSGSAYEYMRRTRWNTNYWFNLFQNSPALPNDKSDLNTFGFRVGGPIVTDRVFYFFNYEEFRQPLSVTRTRTVLTPDSLKGVFDYAGGSVNLLTLAAAKGQTSTTDPSIMKMLTDINATLGQGSQIAGSNSVTNAFSFQNTSTGRRIYPTARFDVNVTKNNRVGLSAYLQDYISKPDILNSADPRFPGYPMQGNQVSWRPALMANWRTVLGANLVNEARLGDMGWKPVHFFDNVTADQFPGGVYLSIPLVTSPYCCGNWEQRASPALNFEDTLNWIKGSHTFTFGGSFTRVGYTDTYQYFTPRAGIGFDTNTDPAASMFTTANFPGASSSDLSNARALYALLTGRVTSLNNTAYLDPSTGQYAYMGPWQYWVKQKEYGFFAQDSWKLKPNVTLNAGLRWEAQLPFYSANHFFTQLVDYSMLYGISGVDANGNPNYFVPGATAGSNVVQLRELTPGSPPYSTDWNNLAPSLGVAWRPSVRSGSWLEKLLSKDPVFRGGYSKAYTREGMADSADIFSYNQGGSIDASRNTSLGNLIAPGESYPLLYRESSRLGAPAFPNAPAYPVTPVITSSVNAFYPDTQTPWVHSFNVSYQRALSKDTAVDIRYVGTRARGGWVDGGYNLSQLNVATNGFLDEFKHAQANYLVNEATYGWNTTAGNSFKYNGLPGQYPLPIFQGFLSGLPASQASDTTKYTSSQYTNATQLGYLIPKNPNPTTMAAQFFSTASYRNNGVTAGYPSNFFYMNPAVSGAYVTGRPQDGLASNYDAIQIELRRRMSGGLLIQGSYQYIARQTRSQDISLLMSGQDWYTQSSPVHTLKINWLYELPFGQGKRLAGNISRNWNRLVGGWSLAGLARVQSGNILDFGNVLLVGMTDADLQAMYQLRFAPDSANPNITRVYMLPDDVIQNTIRAYSTSYSSATGYSALGAPSGRYFAPIQSAGCLQTYTGSCGLPMHHYVTGPAFLRIDMSIGKRVDFTSRIYGELRLEALNVLNNVDFLGATLPATANITTYNSYGLSSAYRDSSNTQDPGGRVLQLSWRISW